MGQEKFIESILRGEHPHRELKKRIKKKFLKIRDRFPNGFLKLSNILIAYRFLNKKEKKGIKKAICELFFENYFWKCVWEDLDKYQRQHIIKMLVQSSPTEAEKKEILKELQESEYTEYMPPAEAKVIKTNYERIYQYLHKNRVPLFLFEKENVSNIVRRLKSFKTKIQSIADIEEAILKVKSNYRKTKKTKKSSKKGKYHTQRIKSTII